MREITVEDKNIIAVFEMLVSQSFADWYEEEFRDFIEGEDGAPTKVEIFNFLKSRLKSA